MSEFAARPVSSGSENAVPETWTVHQGDARETGSFLKRTALSMGGGEEPFVQTTITSPPYGTLVDYGSEDQIGFGQSHVDYLASCRSIFQDVHKWSLDTGSLWVVADSLLDRPRKGHPSRLVPLPFELAAQAEAVGWTLREVIIWRKDRTRPWSHRGKLRNGFEYVLFFVKTKDFVFNVDRLRDTTSLKSWWVKYPERHNPWGMTPDNVWEIPIPVQGSWDNSAARHACPFPPELVRRMLLLSSDEGDVVFDPFAGTGAVISGARREARRGLGLELNQEYISTFIDSAVEISSKRAEAAQVGAMTQRLIELRMLKFPKELAKQILRAGLTTSKIRGIVMDVVAVNYKPANNKYAVVQCYVIVCDEFTELEYARLSKILSESVGKAPLSKYGIDAECSVATVSSAWQIIETPSAMSIYTKGNTWHAAATMSSANLTEWIRENGVPKVVPIFSPLHVQQSLEESN